ncbi:MAG: glycosyltransferase family 9 protein [Bacteroidetes bacterium]|nr:glycosyltransferase family 9 protein [Bacteroidota bacterium]
MERILVIQTAFLGDAILVLPLIQKLKEINQHAEIDVLAIPSTKTIFKNSDSVDTVFTYDKKGEQKGLVALIALGKKIRQRKYSKIYSPHRSLRTSLLILLSRCKDTIGFNIAAFSWVYKTLIRYDSTKHEVQRNLSLLGANFDSSNWQILPQLSYNRSDGFSELLNVFQKEKTVALAPGSVWETKKYPSTHFSKITEKLIKEGWKVVLIGGGEDKDLCESLNISPNDMTHNLAGKLSIIESVELLRSCKLLLSNDSAPTHMGVTADIPVITIYCSTIPEFGFYPYNEKSMVLSYDTLSCKPCGIHGHKKCPIGTFDCGYLLSPETVLKAVYQVLL